CRPARRSRRSPGARRPSSRGSGPRPAPAPSSWRTATSPGSSRCAGWTCRRTTASTCAWGPPQSRYWAGTAESLSSNGGTPDPSRAGRERGRAAVTRIVVVGAGVGGLRAAEALRAAGHDGELIVVGVEDRHPYQRPPLSKTLLAGGVEPDGLTIRRRRSVADVEWRLGTAVVRADLDARVLQ